MVEVSGHHLNIFSTSLEGVIKCDPPINVLLEISLFIDDIPKSSDMTVVDAFYGLG